MRVDAASSAAGSITGSKRALSAKADKTNHQATPSPRGQAHGVVRKLGTGHYNATAEARLTSHFGHLVQTTPPDVDVNVDAEVGIDVDGEVVEGPAENPFVTPPADPTEPITEGAIISDALLIGRAIDLRA